MRPYLICSIFCICTILQVFALSTATAEVSSTSGGVCFAGDHYKVQGEPRLRATAVNPVFYPGENATLRLTLANSGGVRKLVPAEVSAGDEAEAAQEMLAEFGCADATNLRAELASSGPFQVLSKPVIIDSLPSGETVPLEFSIRVDDDADGSFQLPLHLEYDHPVDVNFSDGETSPLYLLVEETLKIGAIVEASPRLVVAGVRSELGPGEEGTLIMAVKNSGHQQAQNCVVHLVDSQPFHPLNDRVLLGNLDPGQAAVARFLLTVDEKAKEQEYQLGCEIIHDQEAYSCTLPLSMKKSNGLMFLAAPLALILLGGTALIFMRQARPRRTRSLRKKRSLWPRWLQR